jgi:hypothetical protein
MIDICTCDVKDKANLALFIQKREEWKKCIVGSAPHAVHRQVTHMLWNDTVFRTFNEARRLTIEERSKKHGFNAPLIRLLDEGFVATQTMSRRRLTDRNFRDPKKAVISLVRVIDDIKDSAHLVTRENYLCHEGTPYAEPDGIQDGVAWMHWRKKQTNFDKLSGTTQEKRERSDRIQKSILESLSKELKICDSVREYVNKFIAHVSDPETNPELTEKEKKITLNKLDECYRAIVCVGSFLGAAFLYEHLLGSVPTPQYDQLKNMHLPMVAKPDMDKLYTFWHERCREVDGWHKNLERIKG